MPFFNSCIFIQACISNRMDNRREVWENHMHVFALILNKKIPITNSLHSDFILNQNQPSPSKD